MSENFAVEIISPDKLIFKTDTTEVTIPSYEGQMGILKNHIPLITFLRPGLITIKTNNGNKSFFVDDLHIFCALSLYYRDNTTSYHSIVDLIHMISGRTLHGPHFVCQWHMI